MNKITLNDGNKIPSIGFGTYTLKGATGINTINRAIETGYRLIDTAAMYLNEVEVGQAIKASVVPRHNLFITTKVWRDNLGYKSTKKAFEQSLEKLQLNDVDLYLIHWPANARNYSNWQKANADTWLAMEELQSEGKIKSIGVSNFWPEHLESLLKTAKVKPAVNQIEFHPGYWQPEVSKFCRAHGIVVEAWSPLARGTVFKNKLLSEIADNHDKSISQICLRWVIQHGVVAIPKSNTPERVEENMDIFNFNLSEKEMKTIDNMPEMGFSGELPNYWPDIMKG